MHDHEPVEFLGTGEDARVADEELPDRPSRSPLRRRLLVVAALVVALAVVVAVVLRVADSSSPEAGPPTVTVQPSAPADTTDPSDGGGVQAAKPPAVLPVLHHLTRAGIAAAQAECPRLAPSCSTTGETPSTVLGAVRAAYPRADHLVAVSAIAYSDTSGPRLVYRLLSARAGRATITVGIRQLQSGDGAESEKQLGAAENVYRTQTTVRGGLLVEVQVSVPRSVTLGRGPMRRLVADERLLGVG